VLKEATSVNPSDHPLPNVEEETIELDLVREELNRIMTSRHFRTSRRSKEFLQYVVDQKISGNGDLLKERLIGVQLFGRKPDYATGEDPVVRVQAGDVRRRLESYQADPDIQSDILIQMPLGSYAPVFHLRTNARDQEMSKGEVAKQPPAQADSSRGTYRLPEDVHESSIERRQTEDGAPASTGSVQVKDEINAVSLPGRDSSRTETQTETHFTDAPKRERRGSVTLRWSVVPVLACLAVIGYLGKLYFHKSPDLATKSFWLPASGSSKPVLLCLPRPMVYRPSEKLFERYRRTHPNAFATREARQDQILPIENTDTIQWGDMVPSRNAGPGIGGVIAAINMSKLLTEQGIRFELRFGKEATYAEMRGSPVLIIGGINTEWATELVSESNFVFDETLGSPNIHETGGAKRVWKQQTSEGHVTRDYGLITRQLSGKAGPFLVQVAGISHFGTAAASEILVQPQELEKVLRSESINLQKKNLQIVVSTDVTDERAGPPHIVAVSSW
jgi:hypothetical protein